MESVRNHNVDERGEGIPLSDRRSDVKFLSWPKEGFEAAACIVEERHNVRDELFWKIKSFQRRSDCEFLYAVIGLLLVISDEEQSLTFAFRPLLESSKILIVVRMHWLMHPSRRNARCARLRIVGDSRRIFPRRFANILDATSSRRSGASP